MDPEFHEAIAAIARGQADELAALIAAHPGLVHRRSSIGHPCLLHMVAVDAAKIADPVGMATILVEAGAELPESLVAAASVDARAVLRLLLDRGAELDPPGWAALDEALYWAHHDLIAELVERGATVRNLRRAAGLGDLEAIQRFFGPDGALTDDAGPVGSPFSDTVAPQRASVPADIVDNAFVMALENGQRAAAMALLAHGARVNGTPPGFHWRGTALHGAVHRDDRADVEWLLSLGADLTIHDGTWNATPLGWADHLGRSELAELLRARGGA